MISTPLISVIVPIYNGEQFLRQCIESILKQSYSNLEILLINDGSFDSSGEICDKYALLDKRIRVFHELNAGVSAARNKGIENSHGEYISFIDSDDVIDFDMYEKMLKCISEANEVIEVVYVPYRRIDTDGNFISKKFLKGNGSYYIYNQEKALINCLLGLNNFDSYIWNGLYKKEIIPRFDEEKIVSEDLLFSVTVITHIGNKYVAILDDPKYNYRINKSGSILVGVEKRYRCTIDALEAIKREIDKGRYDDCVYKAFYRRSLNMDLNLLSKFCYSKSKNRILFDDLRNRVKYDSRYAFKGRQGILVSTLLGELPKSVYAFIFFLLK